LIITFFADPYFCLFDVNFKWKTLSKNNYLIILYIFITFNIRFDEFVTHEATWIWHQFEEVENVIKLVQSQFKQTQLSFIIQIYIVDLIVNSTTNFDKSIEWTECETSNTMKWWRLLTFSCLWINLSIECNQLKMKSKRLIQ
jgi:hypothetical protein